ncbi:class I SAM-dependent methyltransferase [Streptomyces virginiae]|uniref:Methyltransferase domain-containing protein n=1 Tax=Streptomyces virginiae TaxID=1961 RepID=A0ABZ1T9K9_STRVG|nr:methyltransferase domain-containing protein [Streptomyces virginiae]
MAFDTQEPFPVMRPAVREAYGPANLSGEPIFAGGFINFGYWRGINLNAPLSEADRIRSQQDLYRCIWDAAAPMEELRLLEVGCGLGMGCALALRERSPAEVTGMDIHSAQLSRAQEAHAALLEQVPGRLRFVQGAAELMPFADAEFDVVVSVEAAQHFPDLGAFAAETARVLRPGGRVAIASFFTAGGDAPSRGADLSRLLDTFANGLDIARPVTALTDALTASGLSGVRVESLGPQVWAGWDAWLSRLCAPDSWARNFLRAYERRILDYYLITAQRQ